MNKTKEELEIEVLKVQKAILEEHLRRLKATPAPFQFPYIGTPHPNTPQYRFNPSFPQQT